MTEGVSLPGRSVLDKIGLARSRVCHESAWQSGQVYRGWNVPHEVASTRDADFIPGYPIRRGHDKNFNTGGGGVYSILFYSNILQFFVLTLKFLVVEKGLSGRKQTKNPPFQRMGKRDTARARSHPHMWSSYRTISRGYYDGTTNSFANRFSRQGSSRHIHGPNITFASRQNTRDSESALTDGGL